jgi:ComF family protein
MCLLRRPFFDKLGAPYIFEGELMSAIHSFKYGGKSSLGGSLGALLAHFAMEWLPSAGGTENVEHRLIPVPLHPKRLRQRGFNQSVVLAKYLTPLLGIELDYLNLKRIRNTKSQTSLHSKERRKNVRNAFEVIDKKSILRKSIILVDDVATTGNTLNECARTLKRAGASEVLAIVIARTVVDN